MLDNPQSKLSQQTQQANLNNRVETSQADIGKRQQEKPIDTHPDYKSNIPPVSPDVDMQASNRVKDPNGKEILVPEKEEEGFAAKLKRKIKEEGQAYITSQLMGSTQPEQKEPDSTQPSQKAPDPNLGKGTPEPQKPKPKQMEPNMPKMQQPKLSMPRLGRPPQPKPPRF